MNELSFTGRASVCPPAPLAEKNLGGGLYSFLSPAEGSLEISTKFEFLVGFRERSYCHLL